MKGASPKRWLALQARKDVPPIMDHPGRQRVAAQAYARMPAGMCPPGRRDTSVRMDPLDAGTVGA